MEEMTTRRAIIAGTMRTFPLLLLLMLGLALPAAAGSPSSADVPAVVEALSKKYGLPAPSKPVASEVDGLAGLVSLQRSTYPYAEVTSGFYDWRTVSQYRRNPGLHLGYDIAMPAGTPVRAGWSGTVVSVAPWTGTEWGITVVSGSGMEVTYGHLSPTVHVGDGIAVGDVVGTVAYDHVDVKMRDGAGNYVDFGGKGTVPASPWGPLPVASREAQMVAWLVARNSLELAEEELDGRKREQASGSIERRQLERRVAELAETVPLMARYVEEGLVARVEAEKTRADYAEAKKKLARLKARQKKGPESLAALQRQVKAARNRLATAEKQARSRGITWADVTAFVNGVVAANPKLKGEVMDFKRTQTADRASRLAELRREVKEGRQTLKDLEALYEMGGLPRRDIEAARDKQKAREAELKALGG